MACALPLVGLLSVRGEGGKEGGHIFLSVRAAEEDLELGVKGGKGKEGGRAYFPRVDFVSNVEL